MIDFFDDLYDDFYDDFYFDEEAANAPIWTITFSGNQACTGGLTVTTTTGGLEVTETVGALAVSELA